MNKQTDWLEFKKVIVFLAEIFPRDLKPTTYIFYFSALSDLTIEQVFIAANRWVRSGRFFPKPAELRELAIDTSTQLSAGDAWALVLEYFKKFGHCTGETYSTVLKDDKGQVKYNEAGSACRVVEKKIPLLPPEVARALRGVGGLDAIGMCETDLGTIRAHFLRCYRENQEQEDRRLLLGEPTREEAKQIMGNLVKTIPDLAKVGA